MYYAKPHEPAANNSQETPGNKIDTDTMFKLSYGLFVLTAKDSGKDNGCIINTVTQITANPLLISVAVNQSNLTHDMVIKSKEFNVSILDTRAPFQIFEQFGFSSGKNVDKFEGCKYDTRTENGIRYIPEYTNGVISAKVLEATSYGTHTLFIAGVTQAMLLSNEPSVTYGYYFEKIKPKPQPPSGAKKGFVCKICGYVYEGGTLPEGFVCPLCKHGAEDFTAIG